jgi:hypothetical protein
MKKLKLVVLYENKHDGQYRFLLLKSGISRLRLRLFSVRVMADKVLRCRHGPLVAAVFHRGFLVRVLVL